MTFAEFRKRAREIAMDHARNEDVAGRTTCCELKFWDYSYRQPGLRWSIWDDQFSAHYEAETAEDALFLYSKAVPRGNAETAIEAVGDPESRIAETDPAPESGATA